MTAYDRPDDFTEALQGFADEEMEKARTERRIDIAIRARLSDPFFREAWYVGLWLNVRLKRLGVPMPVIRRLCRENGACLVPGTDPWVTTMARVADIEAEAKAEGL